MATFKSKYTGEQLDKAIGDVLNGNVGSGGATETVKLDTTLTQAGKAADAKATGDRLAALSKEIEQLSDGFFEDSKVLGKNLLNPNTCVPGYLSNGALTVHSDWVTCDYIYVGNLTNIIASNRTTGYGFSMFFLNKYDANKNFLSMNSQQDHTYAVEDGVAYVRFALKTNTDPADVQVESGTVITAFEPYTEGETVKIPKKVWTGKKWVVIGDSLTEVNGRTTMRYHDYVSESTGIAVVNMGQSGTGYARTKESETAFYQRISSVPTDADVVTIFGSGNDLGAGLELGTPTDTGTETICGCINTTIDNLIAIMPAVSLGIVSPTPWVGHPPYNTDSSMAKYCAAMKTICENRSIPFLDLYHCSNLRPWTEEGRAACYTKDDGNGVHPDEKGHALIAPRFKAFLETLIL